MEKKNDNKVVIIIMSIVILVLVGAIIYMFVNGNFTNNNQTDNKENKTEEKDNNEEETTADDQKNEADENDKNDDKLEETKEESLSLTSDIVTQLYGYTKNVDESIEEYFISNTSLNNKTISDEKKLEIAFYAIGIDRFENNCSEELCTADKKISADKVVDKINQIFGKGNGYKHVTNDIGVFTTDACRRLGYNSQLNEYILYVENGCGGFTTHGIANKLISAIKSNNTIVLTEKIYVYFAGPEGNVYKDLKATKLIASGVTNVVDNQELFDKGTTVTYTFKLAEDGSYYFDNSKITY